MRKTAGENVVSIVVKAADDTAAGFTAAKASSDELAEATNALSEAETKAGEAQADLAEKTEALNKLQGDQKASAGEVQGAYDEYQLAVQRATGATKDLEAATDQYAAASDRAMSAQERLAALQRDGGTSAAGLATAQKEAAGESALAGEQAATAGEKAEESGGMFAGAGGKVKMAAIGIAVGLGLAVKGAADYQQQTTKLVTSAGESVKNLGMVQRGMLELSASTNTSTSELASGMYQVESAGFHGANGLTVLKAAAQGAQAEGADLGEVTNAVTSGLNAYGMSAKSATAFTDEMVATVGQGKMTMQDLASSLSAVLPIAAANHISFAQVGGALATMTSMGVSARQGTQDLANTIRSLSNANGPAVTEMSQFGISATDVESKLGQRGLTGTIALLSDAVTSKMGASGMVIVNTMNQSKAAAADATTMLKALPASIQGVAKAYLDGTASYTTYNNALKGAGMQAREMGTQFAAVAGKAHGFNNLLASGAPAAQTYSAAMGKMMGGATGLNVALMLTGQHTETFNNNVKTIGAAAKGAGDNVNGWNIIQKETNFQLGSAEKAVKAMGISLGMALLPAVNAVLHPLTEVLGAIAGNKAASIALAAVVGGVLAGALGGKLAGAFKDMKKGISELGDGLEKLIGKFTATTAAEEETAGATDELDASMDANPIGLIVIAIAALVAGFIYLWTHVKGFRDFWEDTWHGITATFDAVVDFIKEHLKLLATILATVLLGPLGLLVMLIVTHLKQVERIFDDVWGAVKSGVTDAVDFVKDHWKQLIVVILGPLGLIIDALVTHWTAVKHGFEDAWEFVAGIVKTAIKIISDILSPFISGIEALFDTGLHAVEDVWRTVWGWISAFIRQQVAGIETILGWFGKLGTLMRGWWDDAVKAVSSEIDKMLGFVEKIPSRINSALGGLPAMMFKAGIHVIQSLLDGITSMIGQVGSVVGGVAKKVAGFFGLSPAVEGPLSGSGAPEIRGQHFAADIATGMTSGTAAVRAAAARLAGAAAISPGGYGTSGGTSGTAPAAAGPMQIEVTPGGSTAFEQFMVLSLRNWVRVKGGGNVQTAFGRT